VAPYPGGGVEFMHAFWKAATALDPNGRKPPRRGFSHVAHIRFATKITDEVDGSRSRHRSAKQVVI
jgi:hypothetical protein